MKVDYLALLTKSDILIHDVGVVVHQPTQKQIAYVGEKTFFIGIELLMNFKRDEYVGKEGKGDLVQFSDFHILLTLISGQSPNAQLGRLGILGVLSLIFPFHSFRIEQNQIVLLEQLGEKEVEVAWITEENFDEVKSVLKSIFPFKNSTTGEQEYNPQGDMAKAIAEKLKKRHEILRKMKVDAVGGEEDFSLLGRYVSILSTGSGIPLTVLEEYSCYQLLDAFERFMLKTAYDLNTRIKLAGASDVKDAEDWMKDIREKMRG